LGSPNTSLLLLTLFTWTGLAFLLLTFKRSLSKVVCALNFLLLLIISYLSVRNLLQIDASWLRERMFTINDELTFDNISCWMEAISLVIVGTSLFNGNIETYASACNVKSKLKIICLLVFVLHIIFIFLCLLAILPLLPSDLDVDHILREKECGYFPIVLISSKFSEFEDGSYASFLMNVGFILSGLNLLLANTKNLSSLLSILASRRSELSAVFIATLSGFLLTLPLIYETGPSLLPLYDVYGFKIPNLVLGDIWMITIFWNLLTKQLQLYDEGEHYNWTLPLLLKLNPLLISIAVVTLLFIQPIVTQPAPLPVWSFHLGIFFSICSVGQVHV